MTKQQKAENRIDQTMRIDGDISFSKVTVVEGTINGNVTGETLVVAESGEITGNLNLEKLICQGRVNGEVTARAVTVGATASIQGPLCIESLQIDNGAKIDCQVGRPGNRLEKKKIDPILSRAAGKGEEKARKKVPRKPVKKVKPPVKEKPVKKKIPQPAQPVKESNKEAAKAVQTEQKLDERKIPQPVRTEQRVVEKEISQPVQPEEKLVERTGRKQEEEVENEGMALPVNQPIPMEAVVSSSFFAGGNRKKIAHSIVNAINASKEMIKVVGALGSGKTTLCQYVCEELGYTMRIVRLDNVVGSTKAVFQRIAEELGVPIDNKLGQVEILTALKKEITDPVVLVLDNCHELYPATLEGIIKSLSQAYVSNGNLIQIILFGDELLDRNLDPKAVAYFVASSECSFEIQPLSMTEVKEYVAFKLGLIQKCTNSDVPVDFPDESVAKVCTLSQGVIGRIDRIVEGAIEMAGKKRKNTVIPKFIKNM